MVIQLYLYFTSFYLNFRKRYGVEDDSVFVGLDRRQGDDRFPPLCFSPPSSTQNRETQ